MPSMRINDDSPTLKEIKDTTLTPKSSWISEEFSEEWNKGIIVKMSKKGNLRDCNNWRGICVLRAIAKIIAKIILEKLKKMLDLRHN